MISREIGGIYVPVGVPEGAFTQAERIRERRSTGPKTVSK